MNQTPTLQDQLSQVIQQLAQMALNRYESAERLDKIDQQIGLLRDSVIQLNQQISQQPKPDAE